MIADEGARSPARLGPFVQAEKQSAPSQFKLHYYSTRPMPPLGENWS